MANSAGQSFKDPLWIASNGSADITYAADEWRDVLAMLGGGGLRDASSFLPQTAGGLTVTFKPGMALVRGNKTNYGSGIPTQGFYLAHLTADAALVFTAGPSGSGQSRVDLVLVRIYDAAVSGSGLKEAKLEIFQGTPGSPGAVPTAADIPAGSLVVAGVRLGQNAAAINGTSVVNGDTGKVLLSSSYRTINVPSGLSKSDGSPNFVDLASAQTVDGAKTFPAGVARGSGQVRGVNRVFARTNRVITVPNSNFFDDAAGWTYVPFEDVLQYVHDDGFTYSTGDSRINLDGGSYRVSGLVTLAAPGNSFFACRLKTAGGSIQYLNRPHAPSSTFGDSITLPFAADFHNYFAGFWLEVKQQSGAARNISIDDNDGRRSFISVVGDA